MPITNNKILTPITYVQSLERKPTPSQTRTYQELQAKFDQGSEDLRIKLNALIDSLLLTTSDSGAKNIGVQTIPGIVGNDVQTVLLAILDLARNSQSGNLLPGIITDEMLSNDNLAIKTRLLSVITDNARLTMSKTLTGAINELFTSVDNGKNSVYSAIVGMGSVPVSKDFISLVNGINAIIKGQGVAIESQVLQGITFSNADGVLRTGTLKQFAAGEFVLLNDVRMLGGVNTTPVKYAQYNFTQSGVIRITFGLYSGHTGATANGQIYKNGVAFGTLRGTTSQTSIAYTEDIVVNSGDLIQLYLWNSSNYYVWSDYLVIKELSPFTKTL